MIKHLNRIALGLSRVAEGIAVLAVFAVTALIGFQIIMRELFSTGLPWADEAARYAGLIIVFLGAPILMVRNEHVKVDMLTDRLKGRARALTLVAIDVSMVAFSGMFLVAGWFFLERAARFSTPAIGMPNLIFYMPAAIGMALLLLVAVCRVATGLSALSGEDNRP